jgi:Uncharacterized flavoproteins
MSFLQLKPGLYSVGVLNPNLRVFDVVMKTEYGTSYNSFLIKDEKIALVEASHRTFFKEFLENVGEVTPAESVDYIILNHTEPDHSGALSLIAENFPKAKIVCSKAASIYLKKITNKELDLLVVKDGDTLSLGKTNLKFISAPFLHWPDTMFTYAENLGAVFTCDFLGTHYCEPNMIDSRVTYPAKFLYAVKVYYDAIMSPFKQYVLKGLEKLEGLKFDTVLVSHGPILTGNGLLPEIKKLYKEWSAEKKNGLSIPVFYVSAYGFTKKLANEAVKVIKSALPDVKCEAYDIIENDIGALASLMNASDGFLVGSPTINKAALPPVWDLLSRLDVINAQKKAVGVFGSYGWSGEAVPSIIGSLAPLRVKVIGEGFKANFNPNGTEIEGMREYVKTFLKEIG